MDLHSALRFFGLSPSQVTPDDGKLCPNCQRRKTRNFAVLKPCEHKICTTCLDSLYDNYTGTSSLFDCPFCKSSVEDYVINTGQPESSDRK